jgi:hypothetical protein
MFGDLLLMLLTGTVYRFLLVERRDISNGGIVGHALRLPDHELGKRCACPTAPDRERDLRSMLPSFFPKILGHCLRARRSPIKSIPYG